MRTKFFFSKKIEFDAEELRQQLIKNEVRAIDECAVMENFYSRQQDASYDDIIHSYRENRERLLVYLQFLFNSLESQDSLEFDFSFLNFMILMNPIKKALPAPLERKMITHPEWEETKKKSCLS